MGRRERDQVRQAVLDDMTAAVDALVTRIRAQVPAYRTLDGTQLPEVRGIAAWVLTRALDLWVDESAFDGADLRRFRSIGAARAADGRPLPAVLRAYRVASQAAMEVVEARAPGLLDTSDAFSLARVWLGGLDELSEAIYSGHSTADARLAEDRNRAVRDFLDDLLIGRQSSAGAVADRSARLGLRLPDPPCLLVAEPMAKNGDTRAEAAAAVTAAELLDRLAPSDAPPLVTTRGHRVALLLPGAAASQIPEALAAQQWRGCAITGNGVDAVAVGFRLACDALDSAPAHAFGGDALLRDADAHVLALLAARSTASPERVAQTVLGPLLGPSQRHLTEALGAYLDTGSATAAADLLRVHPQTLRYRLRRVREITGRDPRDPWHRLTLDVARNVAGTGPFITS